MAGGAKKEPGALTKEVASILRARVARLDLSRAEVAVKVGISPAQFSKMLNGQKQIDLEQLEDIATVLDLDWIEVVSEASDEVATKRGERSSA